MSWRSLAGLGAPMLALGALAGCDRPADLLNNAAIERQVTPVDSSRPVAADQPLPGTPMAERVAVLGLLNKRNGLTRDLTLKPGEALRVGPAIVRLRACEATAPWESPPETGAFVQIDVQDSGNRKWRRVFSGWLFKNRPDRNVVEHPIYDVWVKSCAMNWPETGADTVTLSKGGDVPAAGNRSSASKSPAQTSGQPGSAPATAAANSAE